MLFNCPDTDAHYVEFAHYFDLFFRHAERCSLARFLFFRLSDSDTFGPNLTGALKREKSTADSMRIFSLDITGRISVLHAVASPISLSIIHANWQFRFWPVLFLAKR